MAEGTAFKYGTGSWRGTDVADRRLVIDMSSKIGMLSPNETPFFVLLNQAGKMSAAQPKFEWMEDEDFITRTFKADWVWNATMDTGGEISYLLFKTPADLQALEAPPYQPSRFNYSNSGGDLYIKVTTSTGTNPLYLIPEKAGVAGAGKWRTMGSGATYDCNLTNFDAAFDTTVDTVAGYFLLVSASANATSEWDSAGGALFPTMEAHTGVSTVDECVIIGGALGSWITPAAAGWEASVADVIVTVYTPNMSSGGYYEGAGLPEETRKGVRLMSNYTQIFKTPYSITNTAIASSYVGGPELARIRAKKGKQHKIDIEYALLFNGAKAITTDADSPKRTTQGLGIGQTDKSGFIKTHHPGTATASANSPYCIRSTGTAAVAFWTDMSEACERIFDNQIQGGDSKVLFCSQKWLGAFTFNSTVATGSGGWQFQQAASGGSDVVYGIRVKAYQSAFGRINVVGHPLLRGAYEDWAFFVDMKNVSLKTLPGRQTHIVPNAQTADMDGLREYYLTELGLKVEHEVTHGMLRLVAS